MRHRPRKLKRVSRAEFVRLMKASTIYVPIQRYPQKKKPPSGGTT